MGDRIITCAGRVPVDHLAFLQIEARVGIDVVDNEASDFVAFRIRRAGDGRPSRFMPTGTAAFRRPSKYTALPALKSS
jgi:transcriptional regulator GlxA family with amidase domain